MTGEDNALLVGATANVVDGDLNVLQQRANYSACPRYGYRALRARADLRAISILPARCRHHHWKSECLGGSCYQQQGVPHAPSTRVWRTHAGQSVRRSSGMKTISAAQPRTT